MTLHFRTSAYALTAVFFLLPSMASAATLTLSPAVGSINTGDSVTETISVASADQALNAVSGTLSFPTDLLEVVSVSRANSILSLWVQDPSFSNANGSIVWGGIVPNPGYRGDHGLILSVQFRAKSAGAATVAFASSAVLANDGNGTNILTAAEPATITINASQSQPVPSLSFSVSDENLLARITSSTHPDQAKWYKSSHAMFDWTNAGGVSAVRLGSDKDPNGKPSVLYNDPISHKELELTDGVWYFHVQERGPNGWGPISTYKIQIDTANGIVATLPLFTFFDSVALVALVALLLALGYINVHFLVRHRRRRSSNPKFNLMHSHLHKKFAGLRDSITEEVLALEHVRSRRSLTREEERLITRLKKLLDQTEQVVEKGIEDATK